MQRELAAIRKSVRLLDDRDRIMRFSSRTDYIEHLAEVGVIQSGEELADRDDLTELIYKDWLKSGQVGCVFAQYFARNHNRVGIRTHVVTGLPVNSTPSAMASEILEVTRQSITDIEIESLSVLIPGLTRIDDLARLIIELLRDVQWSLEFERRWRRTLTMLGIRVDLDDTVHAEILGMGPFFELPPTRQCPITTLEIRTNVFRSKPSHLNPSRQAAHLADLPTDHFLNKRSHGQNIKWTRALKRRILGGQKDLRASAKVTFSIPTAIWESVKTEQNR